MEKLLSPTVKLPCESPHEEEEMSIPNEIQAPLFEGQLICLAPIDHENDPGVESVWTHDAEFMRMLYTEPMHPLSPAQVKKKYEAIEKDLEKSKNLFYFTIRLRKDDRLLGLARLYWVEWTNGAGMLTLGIGDRNDRGRGFGSEALRLLLHYAFAELNLYRVGATIPEYNPVALHLFAKSGFVEEVRRRQALNRDGRRWDLIHVGILKEEWLAGLK
jgi:RimJ/RimL family protein N-acetyltransferase